jgi:hypothetical protein
LADQPSQPPVGKPPPGDAAGPGQGPTETEPDASLPAGSFDAQFTFAQALAEACRAVEGALLVVSIRASDIEVGGEGGKAALERLKNAIGRMESSWRPASAEEGFEIVRRRLFDDLTANSAPDRDAVVKAFGNLWYSLQPSVTRLAHDRAASHFTTDDADEEIRRRLATVTRAGQRGDFVNVHPAPRSPADVPDEPKVRLVVLGPEHPHSGKTADSAARVSARRCLDKRAAADRLHRNMLIFLAPDKARLDELRQGVRDYLAWKSIELEKETLNLDNFQSRQAETKRAQFDDVVVQRIGETFTWILVPSQFATDPTVTWEETRVSGPDPLAVRVGKKLRSEEALITEYSGARLRMDLDRVPLWRGDHVGLKQLWSDYSQYL